MIIVTGGAGFIGSNIVHELNKRGIKDILIVDNLGNGVKHLNMNPLYFDDYIDKNDFIKNIGKLKKKKIEAIFHQGACSNTLEQNGVYMMQNNYEYSKTLLHFAMEKRIKFIYASSASVYGNGDKGFVEERRCENPLNVYAFSKFTFDQYVRRIIPSAKSQIAGLRYFNVYGPNENHKSKMASTMFHFFNQIKKDGGLKLFQGSENFNRDFVYVGDVVAVNMFFYGNNVSGIFNCGTGAAESFLTVAENIAKHFQKAGIEYIPFPKELEGKYQKFTQADLSLLRQAGYNKAFYTLEDGISDYIKILSTSEGYIR
jgi:ADP-L-glycero-D-manno-heptose 6-epimerase